MFDNLLMKITKGYKNKKKRLSITKGFKNIESFINHKRLQKGKKENKTIIYYSYLWIIQVPVGLPKSKMGQTSN